MAAAGPDFTASTPTPRSSTARCTTRRTTARPTGPSRASARRRSPGGDGRRVGQRRERAPRRREPHGPEGGCAARARAEEARARSEAACARSSGRRLAAHDQQGGGVRRGAGGERRWTPRRRRETRARLTPRPRARETPAILRHVLRERAVIRRVAASSTCAAGIGDSAPAGTRARGLPRLPARGHGARFFRRPRGVRALQGGAAATTACVLAAYDAMEAMVGSTTSACAVDSGRPARDWCASPLLAKSPVPLERERAARALAFITSSRFAARADAAATKAALLAGGAVASLLAMLCPEEEPEPEPMDEDDDTEDDDEAPLADPRRLATATGPCRRAPSAPTPPATARVRGTKSRARRRRLPPRARSLNVSGCPRRRSLRPAKRGLYIRCSRRDASKAIVRIGPERARWRTILRVNARRLGPTGVHPQRRRDRHTARACTSAQPRRPWNACCTTAGPRSRHRRRRRRAWWATRTREPAAAKTAARR